MNLVNPPTILANNDVSNPQTPIAGIQVGSTKRSDLNLGRLNPDWIIEGTPVARTLSLAEASDQGLSCGLWDCTAGTFKFIYSCDEIIHILEGEVTVREGDAELTLRAGDVAYFPAGLTTYWTVPTYVKKFCIFRNAPRSWQYRLVSRLKRLCQTILGRS